MQIEDKENRPGVTEYRGVIEDYGEATPEGQLLAESIMRHKEAYKRMTKGALPLVRDSSESPPVTPTRKRQRDEDIESDSSSSWEPNSLQDYSQSTSRQPLQSMYIPRSAQSRRSEPTRVLESTSDIDSWRPLELFQKQPNATDTEKEDPSPAWMIELLETIRPKYPESSFGSEGDKVKCFDCEGQLFILGAKRNIGNFEKHLVTKRHQGNVQTRQERVAARSVTTPSQLSSLDLHVPASIAQSIHQDRTTLKDARARYLRALENDGTTKEIRLSFVERRIADSEVANKESLNQMKESFDTLQHYNENQIKYLDEWFKMTQEAADGRVRELRTRFDQSERKATDRFDDLVESVNKLSQATDKFDKTSAELKKTETDLRKANNAFEEVIRDKVANSSGKLDSSMARVKERLEVIIERVGKAERKLRVSNDRFEELLDKVRDDLGRLAGRTKDLEDTNEKIAEQVMALESQQQIRSDESRLELQHEQESRNELSDRIDANFRQHADRCSLLEIESEVRLQIFEKLMEQRVQAITMNATLKMAAMESAYLQKTKSLEKELAQQSDKIDQFERIIPLLMEDTVETRQFVEKRAAIRKAYSVSRKPAHRTSNSGHPRIGRSRKKPSATAMQ